MKKKGVIFDLDGTLTIDDKLLDGVFEIIDFLKQNNISFSIVTNTTSKSVKTMCDNLKNQGLDISIKQMFSPVVAVKEYLASQGIRKIKISNSKDIISEFSDFIIDDLEPEIIILSESGNGFSYDEINEIFNFGLNDIPIITLQRNKFYLKNNKMVVDMGFYVAGLEYVLSSKIKNFGKPSKELFDCVLKNMNMSYDDEIFIIGDDIENDILKPQELGFKGVLLKQGKYIKGIEEKFDNKPQYVFDKLTDILKII